MNTDKLFEDCRILLARACASIRQDKYIIDEAYRSRVWQDYILPLANKIWDDAGRSDLASDIVMAILDEIERLDRERTNLKVAV